MNNYYGIPNNNYNLTVKYINYLRLIWHGSKQQETCGVQYLFFKLIFLLNLQMLLFQVVYCDRFISKLLWLMLDTENH